MEMYDFVTVSS